MSFILFCLRSRHIGVWEDLGRPGEVIGVHGNPSIGLGVGVWSYTANAQGDVLDSAVP